MNNSIFRMMGVKPQDHDASGSIRSAGGSFAKMEVAHEEEYFYKLVSSRDFFKQKEVTNSESKLNQLSYVLRLRVLRLR